MECPGVAALFAYNVASLVGDIAMPLLGTLLGGLDFTELAVQIGQAKIQYGKFIQTCVDFIIIAWAIFLAVKVINRLKRKEEAAPTAPPRQEVLLEEIRDLLKQRR